MRQMLVAVDGSDNALRRSTLPLHLPSKGCRSSFICFMFYEDISFGDRSHAFHSNEELERPERERGLAILKPAVERVASPGVQIVPTLVTGEVGETIVGQAEKLAATASSWE